MPKISLLIFYFFILSKNMFCQFYLELDTVSLLKTWEKTCFLLEKKDTIKLKGVFLDSIHCEICGFENDTIVDLDKPIYYFFKNGLNTLSSNKRLWEKIHNDRPQVLITGHNGNEKVYAISYITYIQNEIAPKHEGSQTIFEYVLRNKEFKLISISTIP